MTYDSTSMDSRLRGNDKSGGIAFFVSSKKNYKIKNEPILSPLPVIAVNCEEFPRFIEGTMWQSPRTVWRKRK